MRGIMVPKNGKAEDSLLSLGSAKAYTSSKL